MIPSETTPPISLHLSANIQSGQFKSGPSSCVIQYSLISMNPSDWEVVAGEPMGTTQRSFGDGSFLVWNAPIDCTFTGQKPRGWPRLLLTLIAKDWLGRDFVYGYGSCYLATQSSNYIKSIPIMRPRASSWFREIMGYITALRPSLTDPHKSFTTRATRQTIPMVSTGCTVDVEFQIICENSMGN